MLNRFRDFVKRLELPQDDDVVYRIIDDDFNAVEVTQSQYTRWRLQHDVARMAIVGEDTFENVRVRTTFSIMPENRNYKPFGTSAFDLTSLDPLAEYSRRYDTWQEAQEGHRHTLEQVRSNHAAALATQRRAEELSGTVGAVRLAITAGVPLMFEVSAHSNEHVDVQTPLINADGTFVAVTVSEAGHGFKLSGYAGTGFPRVAELCEKLGLIAEGDSITCEVDDEAELPRGILRVAQAVACISASQ